MEGLAMLRQLIGQVQELLELYGGYPSTVVPANYFLQLQPPPPHHPRFFSSEWVRFNFAL
nr:F-box only protein 6-like [Ipomoea batatas]